MIALSYICYSIDDMSNMSTCSHYNILCMHIFFTRMILTKQIAEIQGCICVQGAFPFVIVRVQQQGAWKHATM